LVEPTSLLQHKTIGADATGSTDISALLLSRNDAVKIGERDRLGRSSRRRADCFGRGKGALNGLDAVRENVFGQRLKTAGGTPALPIQTASFRLRERFGLKAGVHNLNPIPRMKIYFDTKNWKRTKNRLPSLNRSNRFWNACRNPPPSTASLIGCEPLSS